MIFKAKGKPLYMQQTDLFLLEDETLKSIVHEYAADNSLFLAEFATAWTQLINADRFDGPTGTTCSITAQVMLDAPSHDIENSAPTAKPDQRIDADGEPALAGIHGADGEPALG